MASRKLDDLHPLFFAVVVLFIARAVEARLEPVIIETRRTEEEHQRNVAAGRSWTKHSKHIDGLAIDIAPKSCLTQKNWGPQDKKWTQLGEIAEKCGLAWGGRWKSTPDPCHFEAGADLLSELQALSERVPSQG